MSLSVERERRYICGLSKSTAEKQEIKIYCYNPACQESRQQEKENKKPLKFRGTAPPQQNHNAKVAREWFVRLLDTNFTEKDTHTSLTYEDSKLPDSEEQASRDISNFMRRLRRRCRKQLLPDPEALIVTEHQDENPETGQRRVRYHHHAVMRCQLSRDEIESCWKAGIANADRLRKDKGSLEALANYLMKCPNRKHRWYRTRGIKDPIMPPPNDNKYTRRQVERIAKDPSKLYDAEFWQRKYPGWMFSSAQATYNEFLGWSITLKMHRRPPGKAA